MLLGMVVQGRARDALLAWRLLLELMLVARLLLLLALVLVVLLLLLLRRVSRDLRQGRALVILVLKRVGI